MAAQPTPPTAPSQGPSDAVHERRRYPRFSPSARVEFNGGGEVVSMLIMDISAGGIRLEMSMDDLMALEIDALCTVFLTAEGAGGPAFAAVPAVVVRIQRGEFSSVALEWAEPTPEIASQFARVLHLLQTSATS